MENLLKDSPIMLMVRAVLSAAPLNLVKLSDIPLRAILQMPCEFTVGITLTDSLSTMKVVELKLRLSALLTENLQQVLKTTY
jgi:hypothetical protein